MGPAPQWARGSFILECLPHCAKLWPLAYLEKSSVVRKCYFGNTGRKAGVRFILVSWMSSELSATTLFVLESIYPFWK